MMFIFIFRYLKLTTGGDEEDSHPPAKKKKRTFYSKEEEDIINHFKLQERRIPVKLPECIKFLQTHQMGDMFRSRSVQSIQDKVKNLIGHLNKKD